MMGKTLLANFPGQTKASLVKGTDIMDLNFTWVGTKVNLKIRHKKNLFNCSLVILTAASLSLARSGKKPTPSICVSYISLL